MSAGEAVKGQRTVEEIAAALMADPCAHQGAGYSGIWIQHECRMCISAALQAERDRGDRLYNALRLLGYHMGGCGVYEAKGDETSWHSRFAMLADPACDCGLRHALAEPPTEEEKVNRPGIPAKED